VISVGPRQADDAIGLTATTPTYVLPGWLSAGYEAPEFLSGQVAGTRAIDIWALGCLLARVLVQDTDDGELGRKEKDKGRIM